MNAKHQFKYTYNETDLEEFSPLEVTFEMPAEVSLAQMLYTFERYLQACGFVFNGKLDFVEDGYDLPEEEPEGGCMADWDEGCGLEDTSSSLEEKREKFLTEWYEGIAKLDAERKNEVTKNKWIHGMCNPPAPDWKKQ